MPTLRSDRRLGQWPSLPGAGPLLFLLAAVNLIELCSVRIPQRSQAPAGQERGGEAVAAEHVLIWTPSGEGCSDCVSVSSPSLLSRSSGGRGGWVRVPQERQDGIVRRVQLIDDEDGPVGSACLFLDHLADRGFGFLPNTLRAYAYDPKYLFTLFGQEDMDGPDFSAPDTLRLLAFPLIEHGSLRIEIGP
ncbi:hypothetical protein [Streptomyces sp. NPDC051909]|uniref:hypothetical protein n=1 Tax=Streptomyces sp. NPDC051909 TaxID=3154944 RepID=UPI00342D49EA